VAAAYAPLTVTGNPPAGRASLGSPPNIILIVADDLDVASMPYLPATLSSIADLGVTLDNSFVAVSHCCPSRASILRGQYGHNHNIRTQNPPQGGFQRFLTSGQEQSTLATWVHDAGYRTAIIGKYLNGYAASDSDHVAPGWDEWYVTFSRHYYDFSMSENGAFAAYPSAPGNYETDVLARKAVDFILRTAGAQPFFLYVAPFAPHAPALPAYRDLGLPFESAMAPRSPSFNEADVSDKAAFIQTLAPIDSLGEARRDSVFLERVRTLQALDHLVDTLIAALTSLDLLANSYILFTSDNGFHYGEHRMPAGKTTGYEEDIRVPLLVRGPGVPAGEHREHLTSNIDLAPTIAEMAGAVVPSFADGRSLRPVLFDAPPPTAEWRNAILFEYWVDSLSALEDSGKLVVPAYAGMRTATHKLIAYATGEFELYDLVTDPSETENIYATADDSLVSRLQGMLDSLRGCADETCFPVAVAEHVGPAAHGSRMLDAPTVMNRAGRIRLSLPRPDHVRLRVLDVRGRTRCAIMNGEAPAGVTEVTLDTDDLPTGAYVLRLETSHRTVSRRLVVLR
jgi:arylsulfatase A-like enzyme